jgi:hypothetical protein
MANVDSPFGLRLIGTQGSSSFNGALTPCYINSSYSAALFVGDPVIRVAGGSNAAKISVPGAGSFEIGTLPEIEKAAAGDGNDVPSVQTISGVIVAFAAIPSSLETQYSVADTEGVAWVCMDPDAIYEIQADGAIPAASVGLNANLIYTHTGSTVTGLSGAELDTTSDAPEANASNQLTIVGAVNRVDNDTTLTHAKVLVRINSHTEINGGIGI